MIDPTVQTGLRRSVRMFYDIQKLRMQSGAREKADTAELDEKSKAFMAELSDILHTAEKRALREVKRMLKKHPIYPWLEEQKGCGPTMSGVLLAYIEIERAPTVSALWSFCGLAVSDGKAVRRKKGQKVNYNPFVKTKMWILAESFLRSGSPWRKFYDDYKNRKTNTLLSTCMLCTGSGKFDGKPCTNCNGTGGPAPWGRSDAHRHTAAMRYMVKMFLMALWVKWRTHEGHEVRPFYAEEYLGKTHHTRPQLPPT